MWERCFPRSPHIFTFNDYIYGALSISTKVNGVFLLMADFPVSLKYQSHLNINPLKMPLPHTRICASCSQMGA